MTDRRHRMLVVALIAGLCLVIVVLLMVVIRERGDDTVGPRPRPSGSAGPTEPTGSPAAVPTFPGTPSAEQAALLGQRVGFGGGVTGGAGGATMHVTTDADAGAGSLREAVQGDRPKWIVFDQDTTITLTTPLAVGSNTTIDGRGHQVTITGPGTYGLKLEQVSNVIIESLTLHDFGDTAKTSQNDLPDAINLADARGVWIDHNDLSTAGDKLIAVDAGSTGITVSWNHFHDQEQTFQIGDQATADADAQQSVTVDHNFFDRVGYRMPVVSYGEAHVYNNVYVDWELYAVRSQRKAEVYLENNVFQAGRSRRVVLTTPQGDGCNDAKTRCDNSPGLLRSVGNEVDGGKQIRESSPQGVFDPSRSYQYDADPAGQELVAAVEAGAGPQS